MVALAAVLMLKKFRVPPLVMVALPAVLASKNCRRLLLSMLTILALPAVLLAKKFRSPPLVKVALPAVLVLVELQDALCCW